MIEFYLLLAEIAGFYLVVMVVLVESVVAYFYSYYQKIWHKDRNLEKIPTITLGMLDDDIESLKKLLVGQQPFSYDLERLGAVLTALGAVLEKNN